MTGLRGISVPRADRTRRQRALRHAADRARRKCSPPRASACPSSRRTSARRRRWAAWSLPAWLDRAAAAACGDYVLGATLLRRRGEVLTFGARMKNVAG